MFILCLLLAAGPPDVAVLHWTGPHGTRPGSFLEWQAQQPQSEEWNVKRIASNGSSYDDRVDILVEDSLVSALAPQLDTMMLDLASEGYRVAEFQVSGTSAESLRSFFKSEYDSGLVAAVLVGDLPVAWFQLIDDWNSNGVRDPGEGYEEFPCDLFFMDVDGNWQDTLHRLGTQDSLVPGSDGIYDVHDGSVTPEIGLSRLAVSTLGKEDSLLQLYLARAHRYRTGGLQVTDRALVYIDDDWYPQAEQWNWDVGLLYPDRVFIYDQEVTRAAEYRPRIDSAAYQLIQLCAHSWPGGHQLWYNNKQSYDWFYATEIPGLNPVACFYNLFACSNVRYTEQGYCGGCYTFQTSSGLGAIGSAKSGSMLEFDDFYWPLSQGEPLALAFRDWFAAQGADGFEPWERAWYYGMCLVGDGILKPRWTVGVAQQPSVRPMPAAMRVLGSVSTGRFGIELAPGHAGSCRLTLCDRTGRTVMLLLQGRLEPGPHRFEADARGLAAGVYFLVLDAPTGRTTVPVTLVR